MILSDAEKRNTAYHEAGHALVAAVLPNADPLHKVTIIPRGMALGVTMQLPIDDKHSYNKEYLEAQLAILMAGRIAEEKYMHQMTTGAGNDIERATDMARKMVCEWGMSELGPLSFGKKEEQIFLGREIAQHRDYSEETAIRIDEQVKKLVQGGYDTAAGIIDEHSDALVKIAEALLEREILDGEEVKQIINGETLPPREQDGGKDAEDHTQQVLRPEGGGACRGSRKGSGRSRRDPAVPGLPVRYRRNPARFRARHLRRGPAGDLHANGAAERDFEYLKGFVGLHLIDLFQDVFPNVRAAQIDELIKQYRTIYLGRGHRGHQALPRCDGRRWRRWAGAKSTATTKGTPTTRAVLTQFGLIQYFDHVQGTDGFPCKPAPDVILAAMAALGARPEECLMVGDSTADMVAGRRAGVRPARSATDTASRKSWRNWRRTTGWRTCASWCESEGGQSPAAGF